MNEVRLNTGKLPAPLLASLLRQAPLNDPRIRLGPAVGLDCAVLEFDHNLLVCTADPITFATDEIGHYLVHVNTNDIATTGAVPKWLMVTLLLPETATAELASRLMHQIYAACRKLNISVIGGHTEITYGLDRPIASGALLGEVASDRLITPRGAMPDDNILLTKGVPIEGVSILAREFPKQLTQVLSADDLATALNYLFDPGISILQDAQIAVQAGTVTAMHDPTEGGIATALWELAQASGRTLIINPERIPVPELAQRICQIFAINPLATIASGALLLTVSPQDVDTIRLALETKGIACACIGIVEEGPAAVWTLSADKEEPLFQPERDELAKLFEEQL